jgi:ABC-2 type transport system ATP-binding protein
LIKATSLTREFTVTVRDPGLTGALRSMVNRQSRTVTAVRDVSFTLEGGTILGLLGPNGSGKTTTLKCIAGLLTPTAGAVEVLGHVPSRREPAFLRRLGFVMGQRWQLHPDIPVLESFELHRVVYDLDRTAYEQTRDELMDLLELDEIAPKPARKLSLGQRMRCEFVAALLHRPAVVLLDEPTLGLDFDAQLLIRQFVARYVESTGAAVILTSHYLADIEALSDRVMTISDGAITFTGSLGELKAMAGDRKRVTAQLTAEVPAAELDRLGLVIEHTPATVVLEVPRASAGATVAALELLDPVSDVSLADPPLEETLRDLYRLAP